MSPIVVSLISFVFIAGGAAVGAVLRNTLPGHHLAEDSKDVVRLGAGLVGTMAALVLGLLIASAKSSFDSQSSQVQHLTADIVLLDRLLAQYGPEARPSRDLLRRAVDTLVERIWQEKAQRSVRARAIEVSTDLARTRLLLFEQADKSIPMPFLTVLVFWLAIIFASYSLFSRLNPTLMAVLLVFALSASAAIFLILEMGQPFAGLMQISSAPLRNALAPLRP